MRFVLFSNINYTQPHSYVIGIQHSSIQALLISTVVFPRARFFSRYYLFTTSRAAFECNIRPYISRAFRSYVHIIIYVRCIRTVKYELHTASAAEPSSSEVTSPSRRDVYNHVWKLLILYAHTAVYRAHALSLVCFGISGYCLLLLLYVDSHNLIIGRIRRACLHGSYSPSTLSPISTRVYPIPTLYTI